MVLALLLPAGRSLEQKADLGLVDLEDLLDLLRGEMVDGALLRLLPRQNMVGLGADGVRLVAQVEVQLLQLVPLRGLV